MRILEANKAEGDHEDDQEGDGLNYKLGLHSFWVASSLYPRFFPFVLIVLSCSTPFRPPRALIFTVLKGIKHRRYHRMRQY